jgi:hypothetical protein
MIRPRNRGWFRFPQPSQSINSKADEREQGREGELAFLASALRLGLGYPHPCSTLYVTRPTNTDNPILDIGPLPLSPFVPGFTSGRAIYKF